MCGIAGYLGNRKDILKKMISAIRHRGPDELNFFTKNNFSIGMARLKIIDLESKGLCLFRHKSYIISYNGEVYNYKELKKILISKGRKFKTNSDTEVVLQSFDEWGTECFAKFNGMFAIAILDIKKNELFLARDISGEKPLYYYSYNKEFAFSSEAKSFHKNFILTIDKESMNQFKRMQHFLIDTPWKQVKAVEPASYIKIDLNNRVVIKRKFWKFTKREIFVKDALEELDFLISDAVKIRTKCDVKYGLYYSQGLDSSIISKYHNFKYLFNFNKKLDWKDSFYKNIKNIVWHLDFPVGSFSSFPLWTLAEEASKKVKVVISGEGADEIFGGYIRYMPVSQEYFLRKKYPSYNDYLFKKYYKFNSYIDAFASLTSRNPEDKDYFKSKFMEYKDLFEDPINLMGFIDFQMTLPSLLQMGDRMSSAFSLENRCPYLDKRIIEFGFSLPPHLKINNLNQKVMLRKIGKNKKLNSVLKKEKEGLVVLYNNWHSKESWNRNNYFDYINKVSTLV